MALAFGLADFAFAFAALARGELPDLPAARGAFGLGRFFAALFDRG
jgi:hypothetical protein